MEPTETRTNITKSYKLGFTCCLLLIAAFILSFEMSTDMEELQEEFDTEDNRTRTDEKMISVQDQCPSCASTLCPINSNCIEVQLVCSRFRRPCVGEFISACISTLCCPNPCNSTLYGESMCGKDDTCVLHHAGELFEQCPVAVCVKKSIYGLDACKCMDCNRHECSLVYNPYSDHVEGQCARKDCEKNLRSSENDTANEMLE